MLIKMSLKGNIQNNQESLTKLFKYHPKKEKNPKTKVHFHKPQKQMILKKKQSTNIWGIPSKDTPQGHNRNFTHPSSSSHLIHSSQSLHFFSQPHKPHSLCPSLKSSHGSVWQPEFDDLDVSDFVFGGVLFL